jgi:XTP/dITP diphosphohydrolase
VIAREPRGDAGFGYDPVFIPDGENRTAAQLTSAEKDAASHRGRALALLLPGLRALTTEARCACELRWPTERNEP